MAEYKSKEESWERHKTFIHDTQEEGKYYRGHFGFNRITAILDAISPGSRVMEMGCNSGGLSILLMREKDCFVEGVDVAPEMVGKANYKGIPARVRPAEDTGCEDGTFDVVLASELLEHVYEPEAIVREAARILKPGGKFVGSVPHPRSVNSRKCDVKDHHYHARVFTHKKLEKVLSGYFVDIRLEDVRYKEPGENVRILSKKVAQHIKRKTPQWIVFTAIKS